MTKENWINFEHWSMRDPDTFLSEDWSNSIRQRAFSEISGRFRDRKFTMAEVGPGSGHDYRKFVRDWRNISYTMYEGCHVFAVRLRKVFPEVRVVFGGFADMPRDTYDVTYTKDTLEHQRDFREPLQSLLRATKSLCIVSWFIPPDAVELKRIDPSTDLHVNRYAKSEVLSVVSEEGFYMGAPYRIGGNELYIMTRNST